MQAGARSAIALCFAVAVLGVLLLPGCGVPPEPRPASTRTQRAVMPSASATATPDGLRFTVRIRSARLVAGTTQVATMTLENSGETTSVPRPRFGMWITDPSGEVVFENQPPRIRHPIDIFAELAAGARLVQGLTFTVPGPGRYLLYANVSGLVTPALEFVSVSKPD